MRYATDEQILDTIASLIDAYLHNLTFAQDSNGVDFIGVGTPIFNGSPYDVFLIKNGLPRLPEPGETSVQYSRRLRQLVVQLSQPQFVTDPADGSFETHTQSFEFGPRELDGLKIFLADRNTRLEDPSASIGNCATCHSPPAFTDFIFHNTGATQEEYDDIHGAGSFKQLYVPELAVRQSNYDAYLPPTPNHPGALGTFETPPTTNNSGQVDLGLWNVYANPDFPAPQAGLWQITPQLMGMISPQINEVKISNGHFIFSGTKGVPGGTYYVLASTNLLLPATNWVMIATNAFDQLGYFSSSVPIAPEASQIFYKLSLPVPPPAEVLPRTIALFKTPTLRDLGHSDPYLHTGRMNSIEDVILFYKEFSSKARNDEVRNAAPELRDISLNDNFAMESLAAFLHSLDEDYTD